MTGITDVVKNARKMYWRLLVLLPAWSKRYLPGFLAVVVNSLLLRIVRRKGEDDGPPDPIGRMPMPRLEYFREKRAQIPSGIAPSSSSSSCFSSTDSSSLLPSPLKWGILVPVCFRDKDTPQDCWERIEKFAASLAGTTQVDDYKSLHLFFGIDAFDLLYDSDEARSRIRRICLQSLPQAHIEFVPLKSKFRGKLCYIWNKLAKIACDEGCDLFVFVGDDIIFQTHNWMQEIETTFQKISKERNVPLGFGCVCFRDTEFEVFPTFPVIHRLHMEMFRGELFPPEFINQHGDPYLFELYRRWGASEFAPTATLTNSIGGAKPARYEKEGARWCQDVLTNSIDVVAAYLRRPPTYACWNIVVPSYRCDLRNLEPISKLAMRACLSSIHVLIVIDNPDRVESDPVLWGQLQTLQDWSPNHLVRIWKQPKNMGASLARNTGMAQSFGDWCVLLDDDILPDGDGLLNHYYVATCQHPHGKIFVGTTKLSDPQTWTEKALVASQISYFFDIAERCRHPPWGVTANLCVQGRMNDIWFSDVYPRTGGGEDVDFCLRTKNCAPSYLREEVIVSAPLAKVMHPFWSRILSQAIGWAQGDVICLSTLPHSTFYALPNWIEWIVILTAFWIIPAMTRWVVVYWSQPVESAGIMNGVPLTSFLIVAIFFMECFFNFLTALPRVNHVERVDSSTDISAWSRSLRQKGLGLFAIAPLMVQDVARMVSKLSRGQVYQFCLHFDWMDGQRDHVIATRFTLLVKNLVFLFLAALISSPDWTSLRALILTALICVVVFVWNRSQFWNEDVFRQDYLQGLQPFLPPTLTQDSSHAADQAALLGQPFVVLAYQRTGSNYLCGRFHNHPDILMHSEIFNEEKIYLYNSKQDQTFTEHWTKTWNIFTRNKDPFKFLLDIFTTIPFSVLGTFKNPKPRAVGFKLFPEHWKGEVMETLSRRMLVDRRIQKVILRRDNLLELYASKLRADRTGNYIGKSLDDQEITIDPVAFRCFIDNYRKVYKHYGLLCTGQEDTNSVFHVSYEELTNAATGEQKFEELLKFILGPNAGKVPKPLEQTVKQSSPELLRTKILNYDEIISLFGDELNI
jgi:hypothetical protein